MTVTETNVMPNDAHARPALSKCCAQPVTLWVHWREQKAGEWAKRTSVTVCSACRGPADGSRVEEVPEMPWHLLKREKAA